MLDGLMPRRARAVVAEAFGDAPRARLHPAEEAAVAGAAPSRRREFAQARGCARRALAALGAPPEPVARGEHGAPRWPPGVVGSLTHCPGYRACAVARSADVAALGIDAEPALPLPRRVLGAIASDAERAQLADLARERPGPAWDRLLFCAKEAVFKAWFPLTGRWLGFRDAHVEFTAAPGGPPAGSVTGDFAARLLVPAPAVPGGALTDFHGRWRVGSGLAVTAVVRLL
ncbi:4'-phosphopantetheinyl transferase superfamily protein [Streptomyces capparidis]